MEESKKTQEAVVGAKRPSFLHKVGYCLGDTGSCFVFIFASSFLTLYYTDAVGVSAAFVGTMMLVARLFDGASDIFMGIVIEKTNTRWGKARPWLFIGSIPLCLSLVLLFGMPSGFSSAEKNAYAFVTYFFMAVICYTMVNLSFHAILPRFSPDQQDRTVTRTIGAVLGGAQILLISNITPRLLTMFGGQSSQKAWTTISVIYAVAAIICLMICFFSAKEQLPATIANNAAVAKTPIIPTLKVLAKTKYVYLAIIVMVFMYIYSGCFAGGMVYYAANILGDINYFGPMNTLQFITMMIPIAPLITGKFGRQRSVVVGLAFAVAAGIINVFFSTSMPVTAVCVFLRGLAMVPLNGVLFTLSADIVDYVERKAGVRAEGLITSINSFGMKVGTGLGSAILGWSLALGGYDGSLAVQSGTALNSIVGVTIIIPTICIFIMFIAMACWDIDKRKENA